MKKLEKICFVEKNVNLKLLSSYKLGGIGKIVCYPKTIIELQKTIKHLRQNKCDYFILGNGTNVVFEDGGVDSVIICLKKLKNYKIKTKGIYAEAGVNLFFLNWLCKEKCFSGLEWSYGIPGTVGGAICMNAGAFGREIKQYVKYVLVLRNNKIKKIETRNMGFGYRHSYIQNSKDVVLGAFFNLGIKNKKDIEFEQKHFFETRKSSQPYGTNNAGSVFKSVNGVSAGKIIDKLGLKGVKIGDIEINRIHANFFVNLATGKTEDLHKLIDFVKLEAKQKEGIELQEEIKFFGKRE